MPPNTVKVDRTTPWGNPAIVGKDGTAAECVYLFVLQLAGYIVCQEGIGDRQQAQNRFLALSKKVGYSEVRGMNLACWCALDKPCHADVLLHVVNRKRRARRFDLTSYLASKGWRIEQGKAVPL